MKDERLKEFMENVDIKSKELSLYSNKEKGLIYPVSTASLLCRVDYLELDKGNSKIAGSLEKAIFEQKIENKEYKIYDCEKLVPKSEITKRKEDMFTLTTKTFKGAKLYNVSNQLGIHTTFEDKKEAFKLCEEINKGILKLFN